MPQGKSPGILQLGCLWCRGDGLKSCCKLSLLPVSARSEIAPVGCGSSGCADVLEVFSVYHFGTFCGDLGKYLPYILFT